MEFEEFPKIGRLARDIVVTEKIDGTNGVIGIEEDGVTMHVGSRSRWLTLETGDNHGFLLWAMTHREELLTLGPGRHFGEWWGSGIQRGYGLSKGEKRFSMFNVSRWCLSGADPLIISAADAGSCQCCIVVHSTPQRSRRRSNAFARSAAPPCLDL